MTRSLTWTLVGFALALALLLPSAAQADEPAAGSLTIRHLEAPHRLGLAPPGSGGGLRWYSWGVFQGVESLTAVQFARLTGDTQTLQRIQLERGLPAAGFVAAGVGLMVGGGITLLNASSYPNASNAWLLEQDSIGTSLLAVGGVIAATGPLVALVISSSQVNLPRYYTPQRAQELIDTLALERTPRRPPPAQVAVTVGPGGLGLVGTF